MASSEGWHPDPQGRHVYRYHDGFHWTDDVSDGGEVTKDPLVELPAPGRAAEPVPAPVDPQVPPAPEPPQVPEPPPAPDPVAQEPSVGAVADRPARRRRWLIGGVGAAIVVAVVVVVVLVVSGGGGDPTNPQPGLFAGGGDEVDVSLVVAGDPPAVTELTVAARCGRMSTTQTIEFSTPRLIEDGTFEVFLPPPGGLEVDGTFVNAGRRVEGHVVASGCDEDWSAELVGAGTAPGASSDDDGVPATPEDRDDGADAGAPDVPPTQTAVPTVTSDDDGDDDTSEPTLPPDEPDDDDSDVPAGPTVLSDEFDGDLDTGWEWLNEDSGRWSLDARPGWLSITAGDVTPQGIANIVARPLPTLDGADVAVITTRLAFEPTSNFQFAGLMAAGDDPDSERVQFGRAYCDAPVCVGDGLYFDRVEGGELVGENNAVPLDDPPELHVQVVILAPFAGRTEVFAGYSFDGVDWFGAGSHSVDFEVTRIGLVAHQAPTEITAEFDVFRVEVFGG